MNDGDEQTRLHHTYIGMYISRLAKQKNHDIHTNITHSMTKKHSARASIHCIHQLHRRQKTLVALLSWVSSQHAKRPHLGPAAGTSLDWGPSTSQSFALVQECPVDSGLQSPTIPFWISRFANSRLLKRGTLQFFYLAG